MGSGSGWLVLVECALLAATWARCRLTDLAARYTGGRTDNLDIYLPPGIESYQRARSEGKSVRQFAAYACSLPANDRDSKALNGAEIGDVN